MKKYEGIMKKYEVKMEKYEGFPEFVVIRVGVGVRGVLANVRRKSTLARQCCVESCT